MVLQNFGLKIQRCSTCITCSTGEMSSRAGIATAGQKCRNCRKCRKAQSRFQLFERLRVGSATTFAFSVPSSAAAIRADTLSAAETNALSATCA